MDALNRFRVASKRRVRLGRMLAASFLALGAPILSAAGSTPTQPPAHVMNTYVILFRQGRPLSDADKQRRSEETGVWARQHNAAGHKLDPRILAPEAERRDADVAGLPSAPAEGWPVTALLFLEARSLADATTVAEAHPARRYGSSIEVRPWSAPVPAGAAAAAAR